MAGKAVFPWKVERLENFGFFFFFIYVKKEKIIQNCYAGVLLLCLVFLKGSKRKEPKEYRTYIRIRNPRRAISCL